MTEIVELSISNFRGISSFSERFDRDIVCLVGRGDSGKTTVLEAIKSVLSPAWNLAFYDTDFYLLNTAVPLEVEISLTDLPKELLTEGKYGLYIRSLSPESGEIQDDVQEGYASVLTIKLAVSNDLEPKWTVINGRRQEAKPISAGDRAKLNCFMVSDYVDSHFSWNKGNPLHALFRSYGAEEKNEKVVLDVVREAKSKIDKADFAHFANVTEFIQRKAASLGLNLDGIQTTLDFKDIGVKEGKVSLHHGDIPFRLMGKGSRRLASIAIQTAIAQNGGIALIDEIEQGLEPDRVRQIARTLKEDSTGQVILTTHSRDVITELEANNLLVLHGDRGSGAVKSEYLDIDNNRLQGVIRACPEAFFARKIIVCEGSTEIGICRSIDSFRKSIGKESLSFQGCAYVDGTGSSFIERAMNIKKIGLMVSVLCDSDTDSKLKYSKTDLQAESIAIFDCAEGLSIEEQVFTDLPWSAILELVDYVMEAHNKTSNSITDSLKSKYEPSSAFCEDWRSTDTPELRKALAAASVVKDKEWFKRIDHGEKLGQTLFRYFDDLEGKRLRETIQGVSDWVDE